MWGGISYRLVEGPAPPSFEVTQFEKEKNRKRRKNQRGKKVERGGKGGKQNSRSSGVNGLGSKRGKMMERQGGGGDHCVRLKEGRLNRNGCGRGEISYKINQR